MINLSIDQLPTKILLLWPIKLHLKQFILHPMQLILHPTQNILHTMQKDRGQETLLKEGLDDGCEKLCFYALIRPMFMSCIKFNPNTI